MPGLKYHFVGIPNDRSLPEEDYVKEYKFYALGYLADHYGMEWMKFDPNCYLSELVKPLPSVAFIVDDTQAAIASKKVIIELNRSTNSVTMAFIEHNGRLIEFLQFYRPEVEI